MLVEIIKTENLKRHAAVTALKATSAKSKRCTQIAGVVVGDILAANVPSKSRTKLDEEVGRVLGRTLGHGTASLSFNLVITTAVEIKFVLLIGRVTHILFFVWSALSTDNSSSTFHLIRCFIMKSHVDLPIFWKNFA